jgi:hypothetical protein
MICIASIKTESGKKKIKKINKNDDAQPRRINISLSFPGVTRSKRDIPPMHYSLKIEPFSLLLKTKVEKYDLPLTNT